MKTEKWTIEFNQDVPNQYIINDDNGRICYIAPQPDCLRLPQDRLEGKIAAFIVDACNNYERVKTERDELQAKLDKVCRDACNIMNQRDELAAALRDAVQTAEFENHPWRPWHSMARAALAKLEGSK